MRSLLGLCLAVMLLLGALSAPPASAVPGAYRIVMVQADCDPPSKLRGELAALPDVAVVDVFDGCAGTPTAAQLGAYDLVVSMSNANYQDQVAYGNALADFVDGGGVVVQFAYDNWDQSEPDGHNGPTGRFSSGGYEPFLPGDNPNIPVTLGSFDASSPLMQGVSALASVDNTEPELAPEAILVAKWSDDRNLIAYKGRVVSVSAYVGDEEWTGDFARLTINALRWLGQQTLSVENSAPGRGTVASTPGPLVCAIGSFGCSAHFPRGTSVTVTATPSKGFAFSGFGGACTGPACALTMDSPKGVSVEFDRFAPIGKLRRNEKKGTALLTVRVGGPGKVTLAGKRVKRKVRVAAAATNMKIPILAKGRAARRLRESGEAKVRYRVTFAPASGLPASFAKVARLLLST